MSTYHESLTADQIRKQMNYVRRELDDDVDQVFEDASSLGDLRAYVRAQPIGWLIAAAVAGFAVVPARKSSSSKSSSDKNKSDKGEASDDSEVRQSSITGAVAGMAATLGTRFLMNKLAKAGMNLVQQRFDNDRSHSNPYAQASNGRMKTSELR